jgi:lipopolysaccharide transport system ATP-binding protein
MAADVAIRIENLGKRFQLRRAAAGGNYRTLREELLHLPQRAWRAFAQRRRCCEAMWALREVTLDVPQGEIIGLIGRNGAGKSTLLKILSRIIPPTTGAIELRGRVGSLLEVGTGFHPELTGRENIFLGGALLGMRRAEIRRHFDEIVAFAEVDRFLDTPCKHYSSGMYMRLAFAVAAHLHSDILLVDEVLAVGDAAFQQKCLGKMQEVATGGRTVVLVSHDLAAIRRLARTCVWIDAGRIAGHGAPANVVGAYLGSTANANAGPEGFATFTRGSSPVWFARAKLSGESQPGIVRMGEPVTLTLDLETDAANASRPVRVAIGIRSEEGVPVALVADIDSGFDLTQGIGPGCRLTVRFDDVRFYPGRYFLRLWIGGPDALETYAEQPDCLVLHVIDGGSLAHRRLLRMHGLVFLQPTWTKAPLS